MLWLVVLIQLAVPSIILTLQIQDYDDGFCPANYTKERLNEPTAGDSLTKAMGFFIGALYVTKLTFLLFH
jgi:hypothetical protein